MKSMRAKLFSNLALIFSICIFVLVSQACAQKKASSPASLVQKGKSVYMSSCIACHNADPTKPGALGPDVAGSSKELLKLRILDAKYPAGYKPKKNTKLMVPMPQNKGDIDALYEYLNSFSK